MRFQAKQPGPSLKLTPAEMHFSCQETLLTDVMLGDATLFMRADQVEASWSVIMALLKAREKSKPRGFPNYKSGSWGPKAAEALIENNGGSWILPTLGNDRKGNQYRGSEKAAPPRA